MWGNPSPVRYLLVAGGQVLNTGVAKRFIRNALWEEGEPYRRIFLKWEKYLTYASSSPFLVHVPGTMVCL